MRQPPFAIRRAVPADAYQISRLYAAAYATAEAGETSRYPFPQFFDPEWVAQAVALETIEWVVAERDHEVMATAGAVRNIGNEADRIAEGFGLVVDSRFRGRGVARKLFHFLTELLKPEAGFIIGEARTAHPGGWRVLRACGFMPIGFEPFAHVTPVGLESMLLTGLVPQHSLQRRVEGIRTSDQVHELAKAVLSAFNSPANNVDTATPHRDRRPVPLPPSPSEDAPSAPRRLDIVRDDVAGQRMLDACPANDRHASGVVGLRRLEGLEQRGTRFERQFFVARTDERELGCVRIAWDGLDRRARILDLRTLEDGVECHVLRETCRTTSSRFGSESISVSVDVRSDALALQTTLEELGFRVTAYYPAFIAVGEQRVDAIQYTCFVGRNLSDGWQNVGVLDWPPALNIATLVIGTPRETRNRKVASTPGP